jgi:hypothetical protein
MTVSRRLVGDGELLLTMTQSYGWQRSYEAAILETEHSRLPKLIQAAQAAIDARLAELQTDHEGRPEERLALEDALAGLSVLRRERS